MPKRSNDFQKLVFLVQERAKDRPGIVVTESTMLKNSMIGYEREVDIVVESDANGFQHILAIECNGTGRGPSVEWVEAMQTKHEHLSKTLVLVSKELFSQQALDLAALYSFETIVLDGAVSTAWSACIDKFKERFFSSVEVKIENFILEHVSPPEIPRLDADAAFTVTDVQGRSGPFSEWVTRIVQAATQA